MQHQDRAPDRVEGTAIGTPGDVAGRGHDRPGGERELAVRLGEAVPPARHLDVLLHNHRADLRRVGADRVEHPGHEFFGGEPAAPADDPLAQPGNHIGQEHHDHGGVGPDGHERQRRVEQDEAGHRAGCGRSLPEGDHPAHRIPHEDHRRAGHRPDETVQQGPVGGHVDAAARGPGEAMPGQVGREHPVPAGQQRRDRRPVDRAAFQAVHGHDDRGTRRAAVVEVVHRAAEIDPAGLAAEPQPRPRRYGPR